VVTSDVYIPGEDFFAHYPPPDPPVLITARYTDNVVSFDLAVPWPVSGNDFNLPASPTQGGYIGLFGDAFSSDAQGKWRFGSESLRGKLPGCIVDPNPCTYGATGVDGVWTRVPEPSTLVLLGVSFGTLALYRRRSLRL